MVNRQYKRPTAGYPAVGLNCEMGLWFYNTASPQLRCVVMMMPMVL
jgi:hypothetical protein